MTVQSKSVRGAVEDALRSPDIPSLANNEIGRLLGVSGHCVGECRRLLEARGEIVSVDRRLGRAVGVLWMCGASGRGGGEHK
jgi:hypothetical protein